MTTITRSMFWMVALTTPAWAGSPQELLDLHNTSPASYEAALDTALLDEANWTDAELATYASSEDWRVRLQAQVMLGWRDHADLFAWVATAEPTKTRAGFPNFRGKLNDDLAGIPAILDRLVHAGEDATTRAALVSSLPMTADGDWSQALVGMLELEASAEVRARMVDALRMAEATWALQGLALSLQDEDGTVRGEAARVIGRRADGAALSSELIEMLSDGHSYAREMAARSLGWHAVAEAYAPLHELLDDADADVRLRALRSMSKIDPAAAANLPELQMLARDADERVARLAVKVAGG